MDIRTHEIRTITITPEILKLIAEIDEFKGRWRVMESLAPEKLTSLRRIATIESVGSSTRIEGAKLSDREVEKLLSGVKPKSLSQCMIHCTGTVPVTGMPPTEPVTVNDVIPAGT